MFLHVFKKEKENKLKKRKEKRTGNKLKKNFFF
jgi:hypothetical protein